MSEPTKRPWRYVTLGSEGCRIYPDYGDIRTRGAFIACINGRQVPEDQANAELICTAVNSYEAMKEALENLVKPLENGWKVSDMAERIQEAKAALALAKKEARP